MLCQNCKKNEADTIIRKNINGKITVRHLCAECAQKEGLFGNGSLFGNMLGGFFSDLLPEREEAKCSLCGSTFEDFYTEGKAGCPNCYMQFYEQILPSLRRIHGRTAHTGKRPLRLRGGVTAAAADTVTAQPEAETDAQKADRLQKKLDEAVAAQEFEEAAKLRDEIKSLRKE